jgi:hypothetical protein
MGRKGRVRTNDLKLSIPECPQHGLECPPVGLNVRETRDVLTHLVVHFTAGIVNRRKNAST